MSDAERREAGPFGVPEGARASIDEREFIRFDAGHGYAGLSTRADDRTVRVLVGKKGSGKTVYLRRFQAAASNEDSLYADVIHADPPQTDLIVQMGDWYSSRLLTEKWTAVWKAAILSAVASHCMFDDTLRSYLTPPALQRLRRISGHLFPEVGTPRSVYDRVTELISAHTQSHQLDTHLAAGAWRDLHYELSRALEDAPPVCFYIDAVDEEFASAPSLWLRCQKGLFYQVMRFMRDSRLGGRLHLVICIRDVVFSSVLRSEHATRYRLEPHIRTLTWDESSVRYFLASKLDRLPAHYFRDGGRGPRSLTSWLGLQYVNNSRRGCVESIDDYLLRHTRLIPRDIVELGNLLCRTQNREGGVLSSEHVEDAVRKAAAWFGDEQLYVCGNQIKADQAPTLVADQADLKSYSAADEWDRGIRQDLEELIHAVGTDQFGPEQLEQIRAGGIERFGGSTDVVSVLWQNGLLGYLDTRRSEASWVFYGVDDVDDFHLPLNKHGYAFHPCVIDATGISGGGPGTLPVYPYRRA
jgi:hypothetical protein